MGPKAKASALKRKTARPRPPAPPGEDARIALRREKSLTARAQGANYRHIAKELGVSVSTAVMKVDHAWVSNDAETGVDQFNVNMGYAF